MPPKGYIVEVLNADDAERTIEAQAICSVGREMASNVDDFARVYDASW